MNISKPLRIVWVTNNYIPYVSGVTQALCALQPALHALGHEVFIVTLDFLGNRHQDPDWVIRIPSFVRFKRRGNYMAVPQRPYTHILRILKNLNPAIIHTHHPFLLGMAALRAAKVLYKPLVFTHHTLYHAYAHHVPLPSWLVCQCIDMRIKRYCAMVDRVIAPSEPIRQLLANYGCGNNITVLPSGIRAALIADAPSSVSMNTIHLLVVGRFSPEKNLTFILEAFAQLQQQERYVLTLAGYGPQLHFLRSYAYHTHGFTQHQVRFIVYPDEKTLIELYRKAHLFLFASRSDTQGLVLAEAMAQGVPVIACHGPGQSAIVQHGSNGFLIDTPAEMAHCIAYSVADHQRYQQLRVHAWNIGQRYDPRLLARDLERVYTGLLAR